MKRSIESVARKATYKEMAETLGLVPKFFDGLPDEVIAQEWSIFKKAMLEETTVPNKYKELISLGAAAAVKCPFCTEFHTEAAKLNGATQEEIGEALLMVKSTVGWSSYLHGSQYDRALFHEEVKKITDFVRNKKKAA